MTATAVSRRQSRQKTQPPPRPHTNKELPSLQNDTGSKSKSHSSSAVWKKRREGLDWGGDVRTLDVGRRQPVVGQHHRDLAVGSQPGRNLHVRHIAAHRRCDGRAADEPSDTKPRVRGPPNGQEDGPGRQPLLLLGCGRVGGRNAWWPWLCGPPVMAAWPSDPKSHTWAAVSTAVGGAASSTGGRHSRPWVRNFAEASRSRASRPKKEMSSLKVALLIHSASSSCGRAVRSSNRAQQKKSEGSGAAQSWQEEARNTMGSDQRHRPSGGGLDTCMGTDQRHQQSEGERNTMGRPTPSAIRGRTK